MSRLRRLLPTVAALLAVLVVVQATDLLACADENGQTEETAHHDAPTTPTAHDAPAPGSQHDDGDHETPADCLCHVVFVPMAVVPEVGMRPAPIAIDYGPFVWGLPDADGQGMEPVPLARA